MRKFSVVFLLGALFLAPLSALAEDVNAIFEKVNTYIEQKNFTKALEELKWAENEIGKMHTEQLKSFFPDELAGFKGSKIEVSSALGMTNLERQYTKDNNSVTLTMTGGSGAAGGAMGGLAGLARMGMMMGGQGSGQQSFRIKGQTANLTEDGGRTELTIFLDSGSMLKLESRTEGFGQELRQIAENIQIEELEKYLKGTVG